MAVNSLSYRNFQHDLRMPTTFGERVTELREAAGYPSTTKLADEIKMSQPSLSAIENGTTNVDEVKVGTFMKLVDKLHTNATYLYSGKGPIGPAINPNAEEAEAASMYRQLREPFREAWMAAGHVFRGAQPRASPSADAPFQPLPPDRKTQQ